MYGAKIKQNDIKKDPGKLRPGLERTCRPIFILLNLLLRQSLLNLHQ